MSKEFCDYMNNLNGNFTITKIDSKKQICYIKDGFINFSIKLKKSTCPICPSSNSCCLKKCIHLYKIYLDSYNVPFNKLQFLWINDNHLRVLKKEEMIILPNDVECPICLDDAGSVDYNPRKVFHCLDCGKFFHINCLTKAKKGKVCLNCTSNGMPDWMNGK